MKGKLILSRNNAKYCLHDISTDFRFESFKNFVDVNLEIGVVIK